MTVKELDKLYEVIAPQGINEILDKYDALDKVDHAVTWQENILENNIKDNLKIREVSITI